MAFIPVTAGVAGTAPRIRKFTKAAGTAILEGQLVGVDTNGLVTVCAVNTADKVLGVAASNVTANGPTTDVFVYDDPNQEFIIQCDDATVLADLQHRVFDIDGNNAVAVTGTTQWVTLIGGVPQSPMLTILAEKPGGRLAGG